MPSDSHDNSHPSKKSRIGDVVLDKDPPRNTGLDYSRGVLKPMCSPFFDQLRKQLGPYLVDKTQLIEKIVGNGLDGNVHLVLRPRRCGKTTMLLMLKSFFCIPQSDDPRLFDGLYIAEHLDLCNEHMGKYVVLFLDFKNITGDSWEAMFASFKTLVSRLYQEWREYLADSLTLEQRTFFDSILQKKGSENDWKDSLTELTLFLAQKSKQKVMIFIDEYEAPNNRAYDHDFYERANVFFGRGVLPALLKTNRNLEYGILAGVTPPAKVGWYSGLNNMEIHALHTGPSIFAGMLMFTEPEVLELKTLSKSKLDQETLKAHYNSYLAAGLISVYNPVSIMSAFARSKIENFWVATGEFPLLRINFPDDISALETVKTLLFGGEIEKQLQTNVTFSSTTLDLDETLTLLYYAGYLTMTPRGNLKIPNREVLEDWATWITGTVANADGILGICTRGPVDKFAEQWPQFMQQSLHPKAVAKARGAVSSKTLEINYQNFLFGLMQGGKLKGWEVTVESRGGSGYTDIRLVSKETQSAVLIELKSSNMKVDIERDSLAALDQIETKNYRNPHGLPDIRYLREYGIACYHLESRVDGRYLELDSQSRWVQKDDPAMTT